MDTDVMECPPPCAEPETLNAQFRRVQMLRARLAEEGRWREHDLVIILYEGDRPIPLTFTSLTTFHPTGPNSVWIVGTAREHPPNVKQGFYGITRVSSEIVTRERQQTHYN